MQLVKMLLLHGAKVSGDTGAYESYRVSFYQGAAPLVGTISAIAVNA